MKHFRLFVSMALMVCSLQVFAVIEKVQIGDFYYNLFPESQTAELIRRQPSGTYVGNVLTVPALVTCDDVTYKVTRVADHAFYGCGAYVVNLPGTLTEIGDWAFGGSSIVAIDIPNSVTTMGSKVFYQTIKLQRIRLSENLTSIEEMCFAKAAAIDSVVIPASVKYIASQAFNGCRSMSLVSVGSGVDSIAQGAFLSCDSLMDFYIYAQIPPTLGGTIFSTDKEPEYFYVACGSEAAYKAAPGWSAFAENMQYDTPYYTLLESPNGKVEMPETVCDPMIATPNEGYTFAKWNDGSTENPYYYPWGLYQVPIKAIFVAQGETVPETKVETTSTTATFTFPYVSEAKKYKLTVYVIQDGQEMLIGAVLFDEEGKVISVSLGSAPRKAKRLNDHFEYTLTDVDADASYRYSMEAHDKDEQLINTDKGSFGAVIPTAIKTVDNQELKANSQKLIKNGQLIILRDGKQFNALGAEIK